MRQKLDHSTNIKALSFTILRNLHYDQCRHRQLSQGHADLSRQMVEELSVELQDEIKLIRHIVNLLPPLQKQIFTMKEIEGYTNEEIMQIAGCTADNLRKNLSRARLKTRETYMNIIKGANK